MINACAVPPHPACYGLIRPEKQEIPTHNKCTLTFCLCQTASFQDVLSDAEVLALMVGCLCHDLDHRGTNNAFQAKCVSESWGMATKLVSLKRG